MALVLTTTNKDVITVDLPGYDWVEARLRIKKADMIMKNPGKADEVVPGAEIIVDLTLGELIDLRHMLRD